MRTPVLILVGLTVLLEACYESHELTSESGTSDSGIASSATSQCVPVCRVDADCGGPQNRCTAEGRCELRVCASDADCPTAFACRASGVSDAPTCVPRCADEWECALGGTWGPQRCVSGACAWTGCPSDEYCTRIGRAALMSPSARFRCDAQPEGVPECIWICDTDADCANDAYTAPSMCRAGRCVFARCGSDAQCEEWWRSSGREFRCIDP